MCSRLTNMLIVALQMPYAGPGGLPPSMGGQYSQYGGHSQTPSYPYMNPQAPYFNPSSYGGYHGSNAYGSGASTGFSGNTGYQHAGHPKYQGYGNQGRFPVSYICCCFQSACSINHHCWLSQWINVASLTRHMQSLFPTVRQVV